MQQERRLHIENILHENACSLLAFKENGGVTQTLLNRFVETSADVARNSVEAVMSEVKERLAAVGQAIEDIPGLKEVFDVDGSAMNPFKGIETEQQQHKFYQNNFNLVVCYFYYLTKLTSSSLTTLTVCICSRQAKVPLGPW